VDLHKLNPWNWFKHEESTQSNRNIIPVKREEHDQPQYSLANLSQLQREIDKVFENAFHGFDFPSLSHSKLWDKMLNKDFSPAFSANVNIASDNNQYTITLEAPGLEEKDLSIELNERTLTIKGNREEKQEDKDKHYYRIERHYGSFERVLAVPDDGDIDEINASMDKGLLTITIPRKEVEKTETKNIEISKN